MRPEFGVVASDERAQQLDLERDRVGVHAKIGRAPADEREKARVGERLVA